MALRTVLNDVLGSRSKIAILRVLTPIRAPLTGREIGRRSGITHYACQRSLDELVSLGLLKCIRGGRDKLYELDRSKALINEAIVPLFQFEATWMARLEDRLKTVGKKLSQSVLSVILYGSVARGEDTAQSDVDVLIIARGSKDKAGLYEAIIGEKVEIEKELGVKVSPLVLSHTELKSRIRKGDRFPQIIRQEGKTLWGLSFEEALRGQARR